NRVFHFEVAAQTPDQAISFYGKSFGWKIERWGEQDYWLIETGDESTPGINGAITHATRALATTVNTIGVTDLDAMLKTVEANGGSIVAARVAIPGVGYLAYAKDPEGI